MGAERRKLSMGNTKENEKAGKIEEGEREATKSRRIPKSQGPRGPERRVLLVPPFPRLLCTFLDAVIQYSNKNSLRERSFWCLALGREVTVSGL